MYSELDPGRPLQATSDLLISLSEVRLAMPLEPLRFDLMIGLLSAPSLRGTSANRHMGLDDKLEGSSERFMTQRVAVGHKVQQRAFVPLVRIHLTMIEYMSTPCIGDPSSLLCLQGMHHPSPPPHTHRVSHLLPVLSVSSGAAVRQVRHPPKPPAVAVAADAGPTRGGGQRAGEGHLRTTTRGRGTVRQHSHAQMKHGGLETLLC
jgi:hypothetical protein